MMEMDPDKINDADRQIEATILKQGQDYAARNQRSKAENKGRAESRARIKEIGMDANAYATAVRLIKDKTPDELKAWRRDFEMTLRVMGSKQRELFPDEQLRAEKRAQLAADKKAKAGRTPAELNAASDANKRSDPSSGGAQVDLEDAIKAQTETEQAEGASVLEGKSNGWRAGYNAHAVGSDRKANPFMEGSQDARDWFAGFEEANRRLFESAAVKTEEEAETPDPVEPPTPPTPTQKPSQSAKAAAKKAAAGIN